MCSIYSALEAKESRPGWYATYFEQYTDFDTLRLDGEKVENEAGESLRSTVRHVILGYQINRAFGVQVNVPYLDRDFDRLEGGMLESGSESGLGDVAVVAHWRPVEKIAGTRTWSWGFLGGIKLATGDSDLLAAELAEHEGEEHGEGDEHDEEGDEHGAEGGVHPHDLVLGSGSTDVLLGTNFHYGQGRFFTDASLQYAIRSEGDFEYRFADDTNVELGVGGFLWLEHGRSFALKAALSREKKGKDEVRGEPVEDTSRSTTYLGPAIAYSHLDRFFGELFFDFPIDQDNSSLQITPDLRVRIALTARF
ncbi:MAG: hypothetical protein HC897_08530 [Thermoanaerobaculia bacterium]|nr:hypothetical protein [Thermoanaerobaculia bacterium]